MSNFLDPVKMAFREAVEETVRQSDGKRVMRAFRNGVMLGMFIGAAVTSFAWVICTWVEALANRFH